MSITAFAIAMIAATPLAGSPAVNLQQTQQGSGLAAESLAAGQQDEALAILIRAHEADPSDPAVLINLGIAYAHQGDDVRARAAFEKALAIAEPMELETASGDVTDSRRLARKALKMLDRGEFQPTTGQLTLRN